MLIAHRLCIAYGAMFACFVSCSCISSAPFETNKLFEADRQVSINPNAGRKESLQTILSNALIDDISDNDFFLANNVIRKALLFEYSPLIQRIFIQKTNENIRLECIRTLAALEALNDIHNQYLGSYLSMQVAVKNFNSLFQVSEILYSVQSPFFVSEYRSMIMAEDTPSSLKLTFVINLLIMNDDFAKQVFTQCVSNELFSSKSNRIMPDSVFLLGAYFFRNNIMAEYSKVFLFSSDWKTRLSGIAAYFSVVPVSDSSIRLLQYLYKNEKDARVRKRLKYRLNNFMNILNGMNSVAAMTPIEIDRYVSDFSINALQKSDEIDRAFSMINSLDNKRFVLMIEKLIDACAEDAQKHNKLTAIQLLNRVLYSQREALNIFRDQLASLYMRLLNGDNTDMMISELLDGIYLLNLREKSYAVKLFDVMEGYASKNNKQKAAKLLFLNTGNLYLDIDPLSAILYDLH